MNPLLNKSRALPLRYLKRVYHVGTLQASDKGCRGTSLEGRGLSVSINPDAWTKIAKLGGLPCWQLDSQKGCFLDFHKLSKERLDEIAAWGVDHDLTIARDGWSVSWLDDELGHACEMLFTDRESAETEADGWREINPKRLLASTEKLAQRAGYKPDPAQTLDFLAISFAEDVLAVDGVWWKDELDPVRLSAPRGVIFPARLQHWTPTRLPETAVVNSGRRRA